jgi:hypothetical protein
VVLSSSSSRRRYVAGATYLFEVAALLAGAIQVVTDNHAPAGSFGDVHILAGSCGADIGVKFVHGDVPQPTEWGDRASACGRAIGKKRGFSYRTVVFTYITRLLAYTTIGWRRRTRRLLDRLVGCTVDLRMVDRPGFHAPATQDSRVASVFDEPS